MYRKKEPKPLLEHTFDKFLGVNNRKPWESLGPDELFIGNNVDITLDNKIRSRPGETLIKSGNYRDLKYFQKLGFILGVKDDNVLVQFDKDWNETVLRNGIGNGRVSYAYHSYKVYLTNESIIIYVDASGDHQMVAPSGPFRGITPSGQLLEVHGFRLWVARGNTLFFTDVGKFHSVWMQRNVRQLPHRITMLMSVGKTLYVSDLSSTYAAIGLNPYKAVLEKVSSHPAIFGTGGVIDGSYLGEEAQGMYAWWVSTDGLCIGDESGKVTNITKSRYKWPVCIKGASIHRFGSDVSQFITTVIG